jgi:hypothetical protein
LFIVVAETFLRVFVIPMDGLSQIAVSVYESEKKDALVGDSQFEYGFPRGYTRYEKLMYKGMPVEALEIIVKEYYRHKDPGRVIILANSQMLAKNRVDRGEWGFNEFLRLNVIDLPFMIYVFEKLVSRNLADLTKWIHPDIGEEYKDSMWEDMDKSKRMAMTRERIEIQRPIKNFHETRNFLSYYKMLSFLKEKNARVCLLRMPVSAEYLELIRDDPDFIASETAFKEMAKAFNIRYVDFRQIPLKYDTSMFLSADHLNSKGRTLFAPLAEKFCFDPEYEGSSLASG